MNHFRKLWLPLLLAFLALRIVSAAVTPLTDDSEGRYAAMCRNMAVTGNFYEPMFYHQGVYQNFAGKPPFFFWAGALSIRAFGENEFAVRLPSLLAAALTVLAAYLLLKRFRTEDEAAGAAFLLGTTAVFQIFAGAVVTDTVLCFAISGALFAYMAFLSEQTKKGRKRASLVMFAFLGLGMLTKGPVALALFGMPVFVWTLWNRQWRGLKDHAWAMGIPLFLAIAAPWFVAMHFRRPDFLEYFFLHENFLRFVSADYGDRYGAGRELHYGAAVWLFLVVNLPWVLTAAWMAVRKESRKILFEKRILSEPVAGLAFFACVVPVAFWSLTSRVLIYYLLPCAPVFSVYLASRIFSGEWKEKYGKAVLWTGTACGILTAVALFATGPVAEHSYKTTRFAVRKYLELRKTEPELAGKKLYFVREMPYTPDFYAQDLVEHHAKESVEESFEKGRDCVLAVNAHQFRKCGPERFSYRVLAKAGGYTLILPTSQTTHKE